MPGDGVGAFGQASPVELCIGTSRITPRASGLGACIGESAQAASCSADAQCAGIERCICGRCIVEVCAGAASCGDGSVCRNKRCTLPCNVDGDCGPGDQCSDGGCTRACSRDGDCRFGERCDPLGQECSVKSCSQTLKCGAGERCEAEEAFGEPREPEIAVIDGDTVAFVEVRIPSAAPPRAIYRARVDSANRWVADPVTPLLSMEAGAPSAIVSGARVDLFFEQANGTGIGHAVSTDAGRTFGVDVPFVLVPGPAWEKGWVGSPAAVRFQGATWVFYEGGPRAGIGLARFDGAGATRPVNDPVVTPASIEDPIYWRSVSEVGAPYAVSVPGDALRIYFTARGAEGGDAVSADGTKTPADINDSIGMVATTDLERFNRFPNGPVFAEVANLRNYLGEREAAVRLLPSGAELTFVSSDASGENVNGLAQTSPATPR